MKTITGIFLLFTALIFSTATSYGARKKRAAKQTADPVQIINDANRAFLDYEFQKASDLLDRYDGLPEKSKKGTDPADLRERVNLGMSMLDRVEKIAIIDSITIDSVRFLSAYSLSAPAGSVIPAESISGSFQAAPGTSVYLSEAGDHILWSSSNASDSTLCIMESSRLIDGSWETPKAIGQSLFQNCSTAYPFLMPDGMTLYFGATGQESLGGYDIFISRRDGDTFMQPRNIGMPYNSPANDYMLAIDELTGAGWWATDRNNIPGKITIYMFVPQELRINYPPDTPGLTDLAFITDTAATRDPATDYSGIFKSIASLHTSSSTPVPTFRFAMPSGRIYTSMSDFSSTYAAQIMADYLDAEKEIEQIKADITALRIRYAAGDTSVGTEILQLENELNRARTTKKRIANSVIRAETER